ncbi:hypothetical protein [Aeromonas hydrophila]|uniref:hypothetical protein n=1 Tax=Aeromonas hydrophila TaxID=644 RepID=UPI000C763C66|nr:hypothetical protein [Aeromonas hydrophila]AWA05295.1 hypothetical protein C1A23_06360 [Aeromonas hydrophila subsp. hydrophila]
MIIGKIKKNDLRVANVLDEYQFVLNKGSKDGISANERYFIFSKGPMIIDPETNEELEAVEVPKGIVKVKHVQERICVVESDEYIEKEIKNNRDYNNSAMWAAAIARVGVASSVETTKIRKPINVDVGDYARIIW